MTFRSIKIREKFYELESGSILKCNEKLMKNYYPTISAKYYPVLNGRKRSILHS